MRYIAMRTALVSTFWVAGCGPGEGLTVADKKECIPEVERRHQSADLHALISGDASRGYARPVTSFRARYRRLAPRAAAECAAGGVLDARAGLDLRSAVDIHRGDRPRQEAADLRARKRDEGEAKVRAAPFDAIEPELGALWI
jgi:hypothetical protein